MEQVEDIINRNVKQEQRLKESLSILQATFDSISDGVLIVNTEGKIISFNRKFLELWSIPQRLADLCDDNKLIMHVKDQLTRPDEFLALVEIAYENPAKCVDDILEFKDNRYFKRFSQPYKIEDKIAGRIWCFRDITESMKKEIELYETEENFRTAFEQAAMGMFHTDLNGKFIRVNQKFCNILDYSEKELLQLTFMEITNQEDLINDLNKLVELQTGDITSFSMDKRYIKKDGNEVWVNLTISMVISTMQTYYMGIVNDISMRKTMERELEFLGSHDQLTGLYTRSFFVDQLKSVSIIQNMPIAIMMADVNGLKLINDTYGHLLGDRLLKKVAQLIKRGCRKNDIVARLGGDEFVVILPNTNAFQVERIINNIKCLIYKESIGSIEISVSFGWAILSHVEDDYLSIIKKAEDQMFKRKLFESPSIRGRTVNAIISTLHEKNKREEQHSHRVSDLCKLMGEKIGLPEAEIAELKTVGLLHDIGKIAIDEDILNKPGKLAANEWEEIKRHSEIGYRILNAVGDMSEMAEYVLAHHERWDGHGYPRGLAGEEIPLQSRIIAIADTFDAITSQRSYRDPLPHDKAIEELQKNAGTQFDAFLTRVFIEKVLDKFA